MNFLKIFTAGFIWCGILLSLNCYGQTEGSNIPLGAMPLQYNPSFAGEAGAGRLSSFAGHNNLFPSRDPGVFKYSEFKLYNSYDHFIPGLATGVGISTGYERIRNSFRDLDTYTTSLAIAPKISIRGKYTLSPSIDFSIGSVELDYKDSPAPPSFEQVNKIQSLRSKAGLLFNSSKYYIGYSVSLSNKEYVDGKHYSERIFNPGGFRSWLQMGYTFQRNSESDFSFTPQLVFRISETNLWYNEMIGLTAINLNFRYKKFLAGVNNTGFQFGFQNEKLRIMFSSGLGLIGPQSLYISPGHLNGNLSFRYIFKYGDKNPNSGRF